MEKLQYYDKNTFIQKGPLYRVILSISLPLVFSNLIQTLSDITSTYWLSKLGKAEMAANGFVWPVLYLFIAIGFGIYVAGASILSQLLGKNDTKEVKTYASHLVVITILLALVLTLIGFLSTPWIVRAMGAQPDFEAFAISFLQISFLGFPFTAVYFSFQAILSAQGKTVQMMIANGLSLVLNILLSPFLIFETVPGFNLPGLGLGINGAAWSSVISKIFLLLAGFFLVMRYSDSVSFSLRGFRFQMSHMKKILSIGIPSMLGQGGAAIGFIVLNSAITSYGTDTIFAFSLINRLTAVISQPAMGIGGGLTAIVGQNIGAGKLDRVYEAFKKANILNIIYTGLGALFLAIYTKEAIMIFAGDGVGQNAIDLCLLYLIYSIPIVPLMGMFSIFQGLFQGSGFTKYSMYMEIGRLWALRLPMIKLFGMFTTLGSTGIWIAMTASNFIIIAYGFWLYASKRWTRGQFTKAQA